MLALLLARPPALLRATDLLAQQIPVALVRRVYVAHHIDSPRTRIVFSAASSEVQLWKRASQRKTGDANIRMLSSYCNNRIGHTPIVADLGTTSGGRVGSSEAVYCARSGIEAPSGSQRLPAAPRRPLSPARTRARHLSKGTRKTKVASH